MWDIDLTMANALPRNFRTTDEPLKSGNGTPSVTTGLSDLHASGSGGFTADKLKLLLTRMHGPVTIFDLRQETHIFVNGLPVSWFAIRDWANVDRSQTEIEEVESEWVQSIGPGSEIAVRPGHPVKKGNAESAVLQQVIQCVARQLAVFVSLMVMRGVLLKEERPDADLKTLYVRLR